MTDTPQIWTLLDELAGNRSQVLGVAEALGLPFVEKHIAYSSLAKLPNLFKGASFMGLKAESKAALTDPWPDLVIAAGRRTAPVARAIKGKSQGQTKLCQIMYPGDAGEADFDLIAVPNHDDRPLRKNMIAMTGAPHRITPERLAEEEAKWKGVFADLPRPWIAVMVGGSTKSRFFTPDMGVELATTARAIAEQSSGSLLVSTSRRTADVADDIMRTIKGVPKHSFRWGSNGENPYFGYLACADAIIVTGDSMSMCSEVSGGTQPVYIYDPEALITEKHARFHKELYDKGYARPLKDTVFELWTHEPLNAADDIAARIKDLL